MLKGIVNPLPQFFKKCFKDSSRASLTTIIILIKSAYMVSICAKYFLTCSATFCTWRPELISARFAHLSCTLLRGYTILCLHTYRVMYPLKRVHDIVFYSQFLLFYFFFYGGNLCVLHPPCSNVVLFSGCKLQLNCLSFYFLILL